MMITTLLPQSHPGVRAWLFLLLACAIPAYAAESLKQAWGIALERDHLLKAAQQRESAAQYTVSAAQASRLPKIDLEAGYMKLQSEPSALVNALIYKNAAIPIAQDSGYFSGVSVALPVFTAGRISNGIDAAMELANAAYAGSQQVRAALKLAVAEAYIAVLRGQRMLSASKSHIAAVSKHVEDVNNLLDKGFVTRHDLLATQVALADAKQRDLQLANATAMANAAYNRLLGRKLDSAVDMVDIESPGKNEIAPDLQAALDAARNNRAELVQLDLQQSALKKQAASVLAEIHPQLGVVGGWLKVQNRYLLDDHSWWLGVALKWSVFDGGLIRHRASQISSMANSAAETREDFADLVELQVRQAWLALNEASARIGLAEQALSQADESLRLTRERYRLGLGPNSDVLDAETRRVQAYVNRDNALYDRCLASLRLQHASAKL